MPLLHDAHDLLAVAKPAGLPVHPTPDRSRPSVLSLLQGWLHARGDRGHLGLVHRLDAGTSGVLLLCRDAALEARIGAAFAARAVSKTYVALTAPSPAHAPCAWQVRNHLKAVRQGGRERVVAVRSGGDRAETWFDVLASGATAVLVRAHPHTGRKHQIRVHLAGCQLPILGDTLYGDPASAPRLMLHALRLQVPPLPGLSQGLDLVAPPPPGFAAAVSQHLGAAGSQALAAAEAGAGLVVGADAP